MRPQSAIVGVACLVLLTCQTQAGERWRDMIPTPKEAKPLGVDWPVPADAQIVIDGFPKARIGAGEINQRITALGAAPLQVVEHAGKAELPLVIRVTCPAGNATEAKRLAAWGIRVTPGDLGKQGYVIRFVERDGTREIVLAGSDEMGTLYACVTLGWLLEKSARGVTVSRVDIRDWPDFKWRGSPSILFYTGNLPAHVLKDDGKAAALKERVDWFLRRKINVLRDYAYLKPGRLPQKPVPWMAEVNRYARERGFLTFLYQSTCIGEFATGRGKPEVKHCALVSHSRYFTWADDDALQKRAADVARLCAENGFNLLALHPPDGGGPVDPSSWSKRSAFDKKRWRDEQRAEADAHVFNIFYHAARKLQPDIRVAYTVYPYSAAYVDYNLLKKSYPTLTPDMHRRNTTEYWARIAKLIPRDVHLIVWHGHKHQMDRYRAYFGDRPACYWGDFAGRWHRQPYFTSVARYIGTNWYNHDEDIASAMHTRVRPNWLNVLSTAEFTWNTKTPGAGAFNGRFWDMTRDAKAPRVVFEQFAPRACRNAWGPEAGPLMAPLFQHGLSAALLSRTDTVLKYENRRRRTAGKPDIRLSADMLREQVKAVGLALPGLERIVRQKPAMDPFAFRVAVYYYRRARLLEVLAKTRYHIMYGSELADANQDKAAGEQVRSGQELLKAELPRLRTMAVETARMPHLTPRFSKPKQDVYSLLTRYDLDFAPYRKGLAGLERRLRDKGRTIEPMAHAGVIRVGVYCGRMDGGASIGHEGALMTSKDEPGVKAEYVTDLSLGSMLRHDCIIYPQGSLGRSATRYDFHTGLRRYVAEGGGAVWFMHDATGSRRSEFGSATAFPEVCVGARRRVDSNRCRVVRHPITKGFAKDAVIEHAYYDHWCVGRNWKKAGRTVLMDEKGPVWVAGQVGKGRVLYDGTILLTAQNKPTGAQGDHRNLMVAALKWLTQRAPGP